MPFAQQFAEDAMDWVENFVIKYMQIAFNDKNRAELFRRQYMPTSSRVGC